MNTKLECKVNAANNGDAEAIMHLACSYLTGYDYDDIPQDNTQSKYWIDRLIKLADSGDIISQYIVAKCGTFDTSVIMQAGSKDYVINMQNRYKDNILQKANQGEPDAVYAAACLNYGEPQAAIVEGIKPEWKKQADYAATHGSAWACEKLQAIYVNRDCSTSLEGLKYLKIGVQYSGVYAGNCQYLLGFIYRDGQNSLPQNEELYIQLMEKAMENGNLEAKYNLDYSKKLVNDKTNGEWFRKAHPILSQRYFQKSSGCYIATAVYGSYDCPEVWTLRRYRDYILSKHWYGKSFIKMYYSVSPTVVKIFGKAQWFNTFFRTKLDRFVGKLNSAGIKDTPYSE